MKRLNQEIAEPVRAKGETSGEPRLRTNRGLLERGGESTKIEEGRA